MLSATAKTIAQEQVISLNLKNVTYLELFNELHRQTGVRFLYSSDQLENLSRIDVVADRKKMREVLEDVLKETSLTCVFEEDMVMLRERQQQQVSELVVKGLVTDTKKQPLPGVTVMIKGTSLGTVTDAEGHYVLTIPQRDELVLVFSFVGMNSREVTYKGEKELNVELEEKIALTSEARQKFIDDIIAEIKTHMEHAEIRCEVNGRVKHFFSIYKKMLNQHKTLDQIYDIFAVRIIVDSVKDCYAALGVIHEMYKPIPGRFKDYIAMPKPNMYQSLHTTLIGTNGQPFEIQIRTFEMHRVAEYGIAAHWKYKRTGCCR